MPTLASEVYLELPPLDPGPPERPNPPRQVRIGGMGPAVRAHFVTMLKRRAWTELDQQSAGMPPSRYNRLEASIMRDMGAGKYEWGGDVHEGIIGTRPELTLILAARLKPYNPFADQSWADELIDRYGFERILSAMQEADGPPVPKDNPPAGESTGGESMTPKSTATVSNGSATSP